jgi:hypothetical protein
MVLQLLRGAAPGVFPRVPPRPAFHELPFLCPPCVCSDTTPPVVEEWMGSILQKVSKQSSPSPPFPRRGRQRLSRVGGGGGMAGYHTRAPPCPPPWRFRTVFLLASVRVCLARWRG